MRRCPKCGGAGRVTHVKREALTPIDGFRVWFVSRWLRCLLCKYRWSTRTEERSRAL